MSQGSSAWMFLEYGDRVLELPMVEETLRWQSEIIRREETLDDTTHEVLSGASSVTGGFAVRVDQKSLPLLLALALGKENYLGHVPETRAVFLHGLSLYLGEYNPVFSIVINRGNGWIRYSGLTIQGFRFRCKENEAMIFWLDVEGLHREELSDWEMPNQKAKWQFYYYRRGNLSLGDQRMDSVYRWELLAKRINRGWGMSVILFTPNREVLLSINPGEKINLQGMFLTQQEIEIRHKGYFILQMNQILLKKEAGQVRGSGEIVGPWYMEGNSDLHCFVVSDLDRRLLC